MGTSTGRRPEDVAARDVASLLATNLQKGMYFDTLEGRATERVLVDFLYSVLKALPDDHVKTSGEKVTSASEPARRIIAY